MPTCVRCGLTYRRGEYKGHKIEDGHLAGMMALRSTYIPESWVASYEEGASYSEIARANNVTRQWVQQRMTGAGYAVRSKKRLARCEWCDESFHPSEWPDHYSKPSHTRNMDIIASHLVKVS